MATPKKATQDHLTLFDPKDGIIPSSERIMQDTLQVKNAIREIVRKKGTVIDDMNNQKGKRREVRGKSSNHGRERKRKQIENDYRKPPVLHPSVRDVVKTLKVEKSTQT